MTFFDWIFDKYGIVINTQYELRTTFSAQELEMMYLYYNEGNIPEGGG